MSAMSGASREPESVARMQHLHRRGRRTRSALTGGQSETREASRLTPAAPPIRSDVALLVVPCLSSDRAIRALNVMLAAIALAAIAPLLLLIALAVKATSRGPVFYRQVRIGVDRRMRGERRVRTDRRRGTESLLGVAHRGPATDRRGTVSRRARVTGNRRRRTTNVGGHTFRIYKFRSMCVDAECGTGAVWATRNDPRVTPIGRFLRQFRLDELPQLYNVLKGDMNIVGPRPERPSIFWRLRDEIPEYPLRQRTRPGITGWAQVRHTYDACIDDVRKKVRFDLEYLQRRSLWIDLQIMARTIPVMLFKRGAC
jgi:lipopolysaccharide/colanic/teichoic acid biosynthesis glycosyltransferase